MANGTRLSGRKVAVFLAEGFEDLEFWVTVMRLREEGADVTVVGIAAGQTVRGKHALEATSDVAVKDVSADDFDAVVVPGGWAPDKLRRYEEVTSLVAKAYGQGKIVGLICHAGLVGISQVAPAFRDSAIGWGRVVEDIPAFCHELVAAIEERTS